jgi:hypothetical protein
MGQLVGQHALRFGIDLAQAAERDADLPVEEPGDLATGLRDVAERLLRIQQDRDRLRRGVPVDRAERREPVLEKVGQRRDQVLVEVALELHVEVRRGAEPVIAPRRLLALTLDDLVAHPVGGREPERLLPGGDRVVHPLVAVAQVAEDLVELCRVGRQHETVEHDWERRGVATERHLGERVTHARARRLGLEPDHLTELGCRRLEVARRQGVVGRLHRGAGLRRLRDRIRRRRRCRHRPRRAGSVLFRVGRLDAHQERPRDPHGAAGRFHLDGVSLVPPAIGLENAAPLKVETIGEGGKAGRRDHQERAESSHRITFATSTAPGLSLPRSAAGRSAAAAASFWDL